MLRLKMYPARNGDAFLIDASGKHILVDAGFASTYRDFIAADLVNLAAVGGRLSLAVCTHIDADHIGGLLEFFSLNGPPDRRGIEVDAVWHNSLRSLPPLTGTPSSASDQAIFEAIQRRGFQRGLSTTPNIINARQGSSLAKLLRQNAYAWNARDGARSIDDSTPTLALESGQTIQVIGPNYARLESLRSVWLREVKKLGYGGSSQSADLLDDAYEMWCAAASVPAVPLATPIGGKVNRRLAEVYSRDTSISNGCSIALIISSGPTRILLLGDAWAEDIVSKLKPLKITSSPIIFDAIKLSHHGSLRNTSVELLSIVDSPSFLVSTDGTRHGHPDFEVLAEIVDRPAPFSRKLLFNYETAASRQLQAHKSRSGTAFSVHVTDHNWIQIRGIGP